jgi:hypothetical protein
MSVEKVTGSTNLKLELTTLSFNVARAKLGSGFGKSMVSSDWMAKTLNSVVKTYVKHTSKLISNATKPQLLKEAEALGLSLSEYLVMLAIEHEKFQENPSKDLNVVFIRFITKLIKTNQDYSEIVHELQDVRESLNKVSSFQLPKIEATSFDEVLKARLQNIFG